MFFRKLTPRFRKLEEVVFVEGRKTDLDVCSFYKIPTWVKDKVGKYLKPVSPTVSLVLFYKDRMETREPYELMIPNNMLKTYEKESAHRLTKIFL